MNNFKEQVEQKTDQELIDIFVKSQDYQEEFISVVENELNRRNVPLDSAKQIKSKSDEVINKKIEEGVQGNTFWIAVCFLLAILGGIISIVAGYIYAYSKRENLQGESYYYYNEQTRKYGKIMLIVGIIIFVIGLALRFA